jgi:hypothetical protein
VIRLFVKDGKWNWVDDVNVVLGFDNEASCCEQFGYKYSHEETFPLDVGMIIDESIDLATYRFDPQYFRIANHTGDSGGGEITVRMFSDKPPKVMYLHLYNHHNGYYSHGFTMQSRNRERVESL